MALNRLRLFAPYVLVLCATLYFYRLADRFVYDPQSDRLGPGAWPKILLVSLMLVCLFEIGRRALILAGAPNPGTFSTWPRRSYRTLCRMSRPIRSPCSWPFS
jgi:hypothetical protein